VAGDRRAGRTSPRIIVMTLNRQIVSRSEYARFEAPVRRARTRAGRQHARAVRRLHAERSAQVGQGRESLPARSRSRTTRSSLGAVRTEGHTR
jgi:hypothetical protein